MLEQDGTVDALELTGGSSLENPMYYFRGEAPVAEMAADHAAAAPARASSSSAAHFLHSYPFEEGYFLPYARQFRAALRPPAHPARRGRVA